MAGVDIDAIKADLFARFDLALSREDPVLVAALFNERVLSAIIEQMAEVLGEAQNEVSAGTVQQLQVAKETAERLVSQAGHFIKQQTDAAFEVATKRLMDKLDTHIRDLDHRLRDASDAKTLAARSSVTALVCAVAAGGFMLVTLVIALLHH